MKVDDVAKIDMTKEDAQRTILHPGVYLCTPKWTK